MKDKNYYILKESLRTNLSNFNYEVREFNKLIENKDYSKTLIKLTEIQLSINFLKDNIKKMKE